MKGNFLLVLLFVIVMSIVSTASAHTPLGGLTVAISPDDLTIVTGGNNRVLYVMDAKSLAVKKRIWLKTSIWGLDFNKDGSKLLMEDTAGTISFINTKTWKLEKEVKKAFYLSPSMEANLCAALNSKGEIIFMSMNDGSLKGKVTLDKKVAAFGINAKGDKVAVLSKDEKDADEKVVKYGDIPKDLKGVDRKEFQHKNDGKSAIFYIFDAPSGKELLRKKIYFITATGSQVLFDGEAVLILNYKNENAKIDSQGKTKMFQLLNSYNYGIGLSGNQESVCTGGLAKATYTKVKGLESKEFKIDKINGWPEYFKGFAFDSEGNAYGTTSAYRIFKIKPDGTVAKAVPVY